ncbi:MAG: hypothetical protein KY468_08205 [Armatimonadetes bacterium]|nr:hypothetical protein [Armatimonadota bacterium]
MDSSELNFKTGEIIRFKHNPFGEEGEAIGVIWALYPEMGYYDIEIYTFDDSGPVANTFEENEIEKLSIVDKNGCLLKLTDEQRIRLLEAARRYSLDDS